MIEDTTELVAELQKRFKDALARNKILNEQKDSSLAELQVKKAQQAQLIKENELLISFIKDKAYQKIVNLNKTHEKLKECYHSLFQRSQHEIAQPHPFKEDISFKIFNVTKIKNIKQKQQQMERVMKLNQEKRREEIRKIKIKICLTEIELNELNQETKKRRK